MGAVRNTAGYGKNLISGFTGSEAERAAARGAEAQQRAVQQGISEQRAAREQITQQLSPYLQLGQNAISRLGGIAGQQIDYSGLPSVLPTDISQDTLFNALKQQAISGIESSAAARGKLFSGTTPQAIAQQVQNLALSRAGDIQAQNMAARQQLLGERVGQQERQYQQLFNLGQMGQSAAAMQGSNIQTSASNLANLLGQGANAYAAGGMGVAQARGRLAETMTQLAGAALGGGVKINYGSTTPLPSSPASTGSAPRGNYEGTTWS
jgi:hypothetical protein